MDLKESFQEAKNQVESLKSAPSNDEMLDLYAYYKQATIGDNSQEEPSGFDFKAMAKFKAWKKLEGTDAEIAMSKYVDLVNELVNKYGN